MTMLTRLAYAAVAGLGLSGAALAQAPAGGDLTIEVSGLKDGSGQVLVNVWASEDAWLEEKQTAKRTAVPIEKGRATATFKALGRGTYAVCVVHDANKNGELDTKFPRRPAEAIGCSRGAKGSFGPPKWKDARFDHGATTTLKIAVDYP